MRKKQTGTRQRHKLYFIYIGNVGNRRLRQSLHAGDLNRPPSDAMLVGQTDQDQMEGSERRRGQRQAADSRRGDGTARSRASGERRNDTTRRTGDVRRRVEFMGRRRKRGRQNPLPVVPPPRTGHPRPPPPAAHCPTGPTPALAYRGVEQATFWHAIIIPDN